MAFKEPSNFWLKDTIYSARPDHPLSLLLILVSVFSIWFAFQVSSLTVILVFLSFLIADESEERINRSLGSFGGTRLVWLGSVFAWTGLMIWAFLVLSSLLYREPAVMIITEPSIVTRVM